MTLGCCRSFAQASSDVLDLYILDARLFSNMFACSVDSKSSLSADCLHISKHHDNDVPACGRVGAHKGFASTALMAVIWQQLQEILVQHFLHTKGFPVS